jgi:hypothetical protein
MKLLSSSLFVALAGLATAAPAAAQELIGKWDPLTLPSTQVHIALFVSPTGSDTAPSLGTVPNDPLRSISAALSLWGSVIGQPGLLFSINVAPGLYDTTTGESFPLTIPLHGVSIESWTDGTSGPFDRPRLDGNFGPTILADRVGDPTVPPSVIQGLALRFGNPAIDVDPIVVGGEPYEGTVGFEIRGNVITNGPRGVRLNTPEPLTSLYVVEDNYIGGPLNEILSAVGGVGVQETCRENAAASTLYRSNRIHLFEADLAIDNQGAAVDKSYSCVPRIFSNFFQLSEFTISITNCDSFFINNTVAFAVNYGGNNLAEGLRVTGGSIEYHNNILWNPDTAAGSFFFATTPTDEIFSGVTFPTAPTTNLVFDNGDPAPNFVSGNAVPLTGAGGLPNLHLTPASAAAIGLGTNDRAVDATNVGPVALTVRSFDFPLPSGGTQRVRVDVNLDNDLEPRIADSGSAFDGGLSLVDIGGDEFRDATDIGDGLPPVIEGRVETVARDGTAPASQDEYGNVIAQSASSPTWQADLFVQGPANSLFVVLVGFGFEDTVIDPVLGGPTQNLSIYQNLFMDGLDFGSYALDPNAAVTLNIGSGVFDAQGLYTDPITGDPFFRIPFSFTTPLVEEGEVFVQLLVIEPDPAGDRFFFTNRKRLELNLRP